MKNLSSDLEIAIKNAIETLGFNVDIDSVDSDKLDSLMKSKSESFLYTKELILSWQNSINSPSDDKLKKYIQDLITAGESSIDDLRIALVKKIDTDVVNPEKLGVSIKAKQTIYKAINELNSALIQLKLQLDSEKIDLKNREFRRGYPEKFANQEFFPEKDYYKEWYNEEEDAVMICPKGTKGEIIVLDNLKIQLPAVPKNKKSILFHRYEKSEQYWRRQEPPKGLTPETEDEYAEYILEEFRRRREGVWFYNNGTPIWLCPAHYIGLQWNKMLDSGGYKEFRLAQRDMYYFTLACIVDPRCVGELFVKSRRTGFTESVIDFLVNDSTSMKNALMGITSKTGDDAQEAFLKYSYGVQNLPFFFQPVVKGKIDDRNKMEFGKVSENTREAKKKKDTSTDDYLNTKVDWMNSTTLAYDSKKLKRYLCDECFVEGTKILMADYTFKNIEEIKVGDYVLVEGDKKIKVHKTAQGYDNLYKIVQPYAKDYIVNSEHRLYLNKGNGRYKKETIIITPKEYLSMNNYQKRITTRVYSKGQNFTEKKLKIDPYIFGLWLGDGSSKSPKITVNDLDIEDLYKSIYDFADSIDCEINITNKKDSKCKDFYIKNKISKHANQYLGCSNIFKKLLLDLDVFNNKHIPSDYMFSSREHRLQLLAGLIDSDGHNSNKSYTIGMSRENIVKQIYTLCKSLGLDVSEIKEKTTNFNTKSYNISIQKSSDIKCKVKRKQTLDSVTYSSRRIKMDVEEFGYGKYYGITLDADNDDDRRLILEDYTITMNCGKREKPQNIIDHFNNVRPTMINGGRVVGKALLGSTANPKDKGGAEFETLYYGSDVRQRNENGRTTTGLYSYFLPAHKNMENFTDKYGVCHEIVEKGNSFINAQGVRTYMGSLQFLNNEFDSAKKMGAKFLNNVKRLDPITIEDAFRDEVRSQLFDIEKLNEQLSYNRNSNIESTLVSGNFAWKNGVKFTEVEWRPNPKGRFLLSWIPNEEYRNKFVMKNVFGVKTKCPTNVINGTLGADPYDKDSVVDSKLIDTDNGVQQNLGSRGAIHGLTGFNLNAPSNFFFLEYVCRPKDAETFFEDCLMACIFYSMPILVENNKQSMLEYFWRNGFRGYCTTRFDREINRLSADEKKLGGIPNSSQNMINAHWTAIESYINKYVGKYEISEGETPIREEGEIGSMPFNKTLMDWLNFDPKKRTDFDASISSGLCIMAINQHLYKPIEEKRTISLRFKSYS